MDSDKDGLISANKTNMSYINLQIVEALLPM